MNKPYAHEALERALYRRFRETMKSNGLTKLVHVRAARIVARSAAFIQSTQTPWIDIVLSDRFVFGLETLARALTHKEEETGTETERFYRKIGMPEQMRSDFDLYCNIDFVDLPKETARRFFWIEAAKYLGCVSSENEARL